MEAVTNVKTETKKQTLYQTIWRWHFFSGIIFTPILIMLAITGAIYLFKPYVEPILYDELYHVKKQQTEMLAPSEQIEKVQKHYPHGEVVVYKPSESATSSVKAVVVMGDTTLNVFMNPYDGTVIGTQNEDDKIMNKIVSLHGELMAGTTGDRIVELAACWAVLLLITGFYLYAPYYKKWSTLFKIRFKGQRRTLWKDVHTVLGFWLSAGILLLIVTGLPWAGVVGEKISNFAATTKSGYPTELWDAPPESVVPTKEVAKTAWAAEKVPVPKSKQTEAMPLSVDNIVAIAEKENVYRGYEINMPEGQTGVYTVAVYPMLPKHQATLHIDQYSGKVLADVRFNDYGLTAKIIEIGIALHEGRYFGIPNLILAFLICIGLIIIAMSGIVMWWKRRPTGTLGVPKTNHSTKGNLIMIGIAAVCGVVMPLVGMSLVVIVALDILLLRRLRWTRKILY